MTFKRDMRLFLMALSVCIAAGLILTGMDMAEEKTEYNEPETHFDTIVIHDERFMDKLDPDEDGNIELALLHQGYYRDDVPLTYDEQDFLQTACEEFGVDYPLMLGLIEHETNFRNIHGDDGKSAGYCQIQRRYWHGLMDEIGAKDLNDPYDNFRTGCAIMAQLIDRYGNVKDALSVYNSGHTGRNSYSNAVLEAAERWAE